MIINAAMPAAASSTLMPDAQLELAVILALVKSNTLRPSVAKTIQSVIYLNFATEFRSSAQRILTFKMVSNAVEEKYVCI